MSFDLLVFDPAVAPRDRTAFLAWYGNLTRWEEPRDYSQAHGMTGTLPLFYDTLRADFPPMNGPFAYDYGQTTGVVQRLLGTAPFDEDRVTDYTLAQHAIYMAFAWSVAEHARQHVIRTAHTTGVGFFDVSTENGVIVHDPQQLDRLITR